MNINSTAVGANSFSIDPKEIDSLRQSARENSPDAIKAVAKQFEGMFMNMIMKSMRDATPKEGLFDSEQGKMFSSMLDQQLSQNMAKRGVGLADMLIRQLSNNRGVPVADAAGSGGSGDSVGALGAGSPGAIFGTGSSSGLAAMVSSPAPALTGKARDGGVLAGLQSGLAAGFQATLARALETGIPSVVKAALAGVGAATRSSETVASLDARPRSGAPHIRAFEDKLGAHAEDAARTTGIPAKFMLGQAALESGWGKREILAADGSTSHNVFGIKAGASWKGKVVETATTEYVNGVPERRIERFRAYDSYGDAFRDYAGLLQKNPRYQAVLANAQDVKGFAEGLQRAGYATDPHYAAKLTRIITHSLSA